MARKRDVIDLRGSASIQAADEAAEKGKRTFDIVAYTGIPLESQGCYGWDVPVIIDNQGWILGNGIFPILDNHGFGGGFFDAGSPKKAVIGQSTTARVEGQNLRLQGGMFDTEASRGVIDLADQGLKWQASVGARVLVKDFVGEGSKVTVNGQEFEGPIYVARKTRLREVSFVVLGDDGNTSALVAAYRRAKMGKGKGTVRAGDDGEPVDPKKTSDTAASDEDFKSWCKAEGYGDPSGMSDRLKAKLRAEYDESTDDDEDDEDEDREDADRTTARAGADDDGVPGRKDTKAGLRLSRSARELRAENARIAEIEDLCRECPDLRITVTARNGKERQVSLRAHAIAAGWTAKKVSLEILRAGRPEPGPHWYSVSTPQVSGDVIEAALLLARRGGNPLDLQSDHWYAANQERPQPVAHDLVAEAKREVAKYTDQVQQTAHDLFGNSSHPHSLGQIGIHQVLLLAAAQGGYRDRTHAINAGNIEHVLHAAFGRRDIRAEGASTISIQQVLANVLNKYLLYGYLHTDMSWREIAAIRPVKDFKPTKGINLTGDFLFVKLNGDGQIQNAALTDEAYANQIDTYARKLGINRQQIINDDTSALTTVPMLMGIGCNDGLSKGFWTYFLTNPTWPALNSGGDGNPFYFAHSVAATSLGGQAINSNLSTGGGSALSINGLQAALQLFYKQVKPNGQPLGVMPAILLYPPELDTTAVELMNAQFIVYGGGTAAKQPNTNVFKGRYKPVMCPYLSNTSITGNSATAWYLFAEPNRMPAIEVAFLNGQETPTVQTAQANFNELGIDVRGFHDYGYAFQNPRASVKSAGA